MTDPSEVLDQLPGEPVVALLLRPHNRLNDPHEVIRSHLPNLTEKIIQNVQKKGVNIVFTFPHTGKK